MQYSAYLAEGKSKNWKDEVSAEELAAASAAAAAKAEEKRKKMAVYVKLVASVCCVGVLCWWVVLGPGKLYRAY